MFNFKQTEYGIMFEEALKSIRQLCTFLLNTSKVKRKGGVCELDLSPIKITSLASIFLGESLGVLPTPFEALEITGVGKDEAGTAFNS